MPRNVTLGKTIAAEIKQTSLDMEKSLGKDRTRTVDRHCSWCSYKTLCRAEFLGLDGDFVRKQEYRKKEKRVEEKAKPSQATRARVARG